MRIGDMKMDNITVKAKSKFNNMVNIMSIAKGAMDYTDVTETYAGIAAKLLGKYNIIVPGKILINLPDQFGSNTIIRYDNATDKEFMDKNEIDLVRSSEGSAGTTFSKRSRYTEDPLFKINPNVALVTVRIAGHLMPPISLDNQRDYVGPFLNEGYQCINIICFPVAQSPNIW